MEQKVLLPLDKGKAGFYNKIKGISVGEPDTTFVLLGEKASVRIAEDQTIAFVISPSDDRGDPVTYYTLFKAEIKRGNRIATFGNGNIHSEKSNSEESIIGFTATKVSGQGYELTLPNKLQKGEYFFIDIRSLQNHRGRGADAFAFGID